MFLSITTTQHPATNLGYLLHKHPDKVQTFSTAGGKAHVFFPEASDERCTAVLLLDIDPVELVRSLKVPGESRSLQHYVNDRPYVASSFTSSAISNVYSSALNGRCEDKPEWLNIPLALEAKIPVLKVKGGQGLLERIFQPLGYALKAERLPLDEQFPEWGESNYFALTLTHNIPLQTLLQHLYVLLPVFDAERHFYVASGDIEILLKKGETWLKDHPEREFIIRRYLNNNASLSKLAMRRFLEEEEPAVSEPDLTIEEVQEERINLHQQRLNAAFDVLKASGAKTVLDLGCGEGRLLKMLLREGQFTRIVGVDVSFYSLQVATRRLYLKEMTPKQKERIELLQSALTYRDRRLAGFDAAALIEVIEHLDLERLPALERAVFEFARPKTVVITTPNREYNANYAMPEDKLRHRDHRFEWTRDEFAEWVNQVSEKFGYTASIEGVGEEDPAFGAASQMAVFRRSVD
ncbi:MAG: 3' terminal RNA ribose 2'-O-methyltransferase Hen1 [Haliscomenobacter sp.]|nr:3' terminal RNA ribose 2'-O-methyltransferase Hen1 [Haliscomenobacter sp.]MBK9488009.1 3' terminal RNA ribose 2'-O-methyltransferase Hen1 [Haliscomenobacter sp.]